MAIKTIKYYSGTCIASESCANVAICLEDSWRLKTADGSGIIFGKLSGGRVVPGKVNNSSCGTSCSSSSSYEYCIAYDDDLLATDPETELPYALSSANIVAIGPNACVIQKLIDYITTTSESGSVLPLNFLANQGPARAVNLGQNFSILGNNSIIRTTNSPTLNQVTVSLIRDPDALNILEFRPNGVFVPPPSLSASGPSSDASNVLEPGSDGLSFLTCAMINDCVDIPEPGTNLEVENTQTISLSLISDTLTANARIHTNGPNALSVTGGAAGEGLYVDPSALTTVLEFTDSIEECGRVLNLTDNNALDDSVPLHDMRLVEHTSHGFGVTGQLIALTPDTTPGEYTLAQADDPETVASHLAIILNSNEYALLAPGFYSFPSHGFTVGSHYGVSDDSAGDFKPYSSIPVDAYVQHAFRVETDDCLYLSLEEAQAPEVGCCNVIEEEGHGFTVGQVVHFDSGWQLATAGSSGAILVIEVLDADTFVVGHNACLQGVTGIVAGVSYVASPDTPGALVNVTSLDYSAGDAYRPVGTGVASECLMVNMSPAYMNLVEAT